MDIPVFVNARSLTLPAGAQVRDAVQAGAPELLPACEAGEIEVRDARGLPVPLGGRLEAGAILRVQRPSRRGPAAGDDAGG
jgi:hypothetical protein